MSENSCDSQYDSVQESHNILTAHISDSMIGGNGANTSVPSIPVINSSSPSGIDCLNNSSSVPRNMRHDIDREQGANDSNVCFHDEIHKNKHTIITQQKDQNFVQTTKGSVFYNANFISPDNLNINAGVDASPLAEATGTLARMSFSTKACVSDIIRANDPSSSSLIGANQQKKLQLSSKGSVFNDVFGFISSANLSYCADVGDSISINGLEPSSSNRYSSYEIHNPDLGVMEHCLSPSFLDSSDLGRDNGEQLVSTSCNKPISNREIATRKTDTNIDLNQLEDDRDKRSNMKILATDLNNRSELNNPTDYNPWNFDNCYNYEPRRQLDQDLTDINHHKDSKHNSDMEIRAASELSKDLRGQRHRKEFNHHTEEPRRLFNPG